MIINPYIFNTDTGIPGNGMLYNWYAASDANFFPTDWGLPTETEWDTLISYLGGNTVAGGYLKETGLTHWNSPNSGADNNSGFTMLGSGIRYTDGTFTYFKQYGVISLSTYGGSSAFGYGYAEYSSNDSGKGNGFGAKSGCAVRGIYRGSGTPTTVTDYDGNVYDTIVIGTQRWTVQNWKCTKLSIGGADIPYVTDNTAWAALLTGARCAFNNNLGNV